MKGMKILKKLVSLLVVSCFILSIVSSPIYSAIKTSTYDSKIESNYTGDYDSVKNKATTSKKKITKKLVNNKTNESLKLIKNLLKKKNLSSTIKTWLKKAEKLIKTTRDNKKKSNATKYTWLEKAYIAIKAISGAKGSDLSVVKQTVASGSVFSSLKTVLKKNTTYKIYASYTAKINTAIDKLLNKSNVSSTVKTWLKEVKTSVSNKTFTSKNNTSKKSWLKKALTSINAISKANGSDLSVVKQTMASGSVFSSLKTVLKNNTTYKIYAQYGDNGINVISALSKKYNLNQSDVYNIFVNNKVTKSEFDFIGGAILDNLKKDNFFSWRYSYKSVNNSIVSIKQLVYKLNDVNSNNTNNSSSSNNNNINNNESNTTNNNNNNNTTENSYQQNLDKSKTLINNLLNNENISDLAKSWLEAAQIKIDEVVNGNETDEEKQKFMSKALASLENVKNNNASIPVLIQETSQDSAFSSLQGFFEPNTMQQIYNEYGETGVNVISQLANKLNMLKDDVFNILSKVIGVTKAQIEKAGSVILNLLKKGEDIVVCAAYAVGAYLNINENVAAVMNLASELVTNLDGFISDNKSGFIGTNIKAEKNSLQKGGIENITECYLSTLEDFMDGLQVGESAILNVYCYDLGGHAITIKREENGYGVFDMNTYDGKEVIYTPEDFKTLMTGERGSIVKGTTTDGQICTRKVYYNAIVQREIKETVAEKMVNGNVRVTVYRSVYNTYNVIDAITDSTDIISKKRTGSY